MRCERCLTAPFKARLAERDDAPVALGIETGDDAAEAAHGDAE